MIYFTKHSLDKFKILELHGFRVSRKQVIDTVEKPESIDYSRLPLKIAQSGFDKRHVLRVVYKEESGRKIIITFYPGRRDQYEKK